MLPATCSWPGNLGVVGCVCTRKRKGERTSLPGYAVYLGNDVWLEDGIGDAAEGGADVDGDDEGASVARVGLAGVWSRHERKKYIRDRDTVFYRPWPSRSSPRSAIILPPIFLSRRTSASPPTSSPVVRPETPKLGRPRRCRSRWLATCGVNSSIPNPTSHAPMPSSFVSTTAVVVSSVLCATPATSSGPETMRSTS